MRAIWQERSKEEGQAMTELVLTLPVILLFFAAVFYFGHGMNRKIENKMAARYAAFTANRDDGFHPDNDLYGSTEAIRQVIDSGFYTRNASVTLQVSDWSDMGTMSSVVSFLSFSWPGISAIWDAIQGGGWGGIFDGIDLVTTNGPNFFAGAYLALAQYTPGTRVVTETTITATGSGFGGLLEGMGSQTTRGELYIDLNPKKLVFNTLSGSNYLPIMFNYLLLWDWDFGMNCLSTDNDDTNWIC